MLTTNTNNNNNNRYKSKQQQNTLPSPPIHQHTLMTRDQQKYCGAIIRNLKKHRDAAPFLNPVDYVKLNVPDYPNIVKQPMDLMMVDRKLNASEYASVDDFVADVRLIFNNCFKYNGPEAMISVLCQNVESAFEKSLRQMPLSHPTTATSKEASPQTNNSIKKELSPPLSQHNSPPQHAPDYKLLSEDLSRPKREIHCPSKDYPETYTTQRKLAYNKSSAIKFCLQALKELKKSKYRHLAYPFLEPVDPVALNLPDYTDIVKQPMDLHTIEDKLMNDEYKGADQFEADMTLMFNNCYLYNPPSLPIYSMAKEFEKVFRDKWNQRPQEKKVIVSDVEEYESEDEHTYKRKARRASTKQRVVGGDERDDRIAKLERNIASISEQIRSIKSQKKTSATPKPVRRGRGPNRKPPVKRKTTAYSSDESTDDEVEFTFNQKRDLSEMINNLTGDDLNTVVTIIQSSMPNLSGNDQEEIVLDIDSLDIKTLRKLSQFVGLPAKKSFKSSAKRSRTHYSATDADKKIKELENTLKKFNAQVDSSSSDSDDNDSDEGSSSGSSSSESD